MVFLSETKRSSAEMLVIKDQLGDYMGIYESAHGRAEGLAILWEGSVKLTYLSGSLHHIDVNICWADGEPTWRFTGVFGWPEAHMKHCMGELIQELKNHSDLPWLVGGGLNEIFYHIEKKGVPPKPQSHIYKFRGFFIDNDLYDLVGLCGL